MKRMMAAALVAGALLVGAAPAFAQAGAWGLDQREHWLQERINRGHRDGSLDGREYARVQTQLDNIRHDQRVMAANRGGVLMPDQQRVLEGRLDNVSNSIAWLRHNGERRPW